MKMLGADPPLLVCVCRRLRSADGSGKVEVAATRGALRRYRDKWGIAQAKHRRPPPAQCDHLHICGGATRVDRLQTAGRHYGSTFAPARAAWRSRLTEPQNEDLHRLGRSDVRNCGVFFDARSRRKRSRLVSELRL
jgi:hypothetical protein